MGNISLPGIECAGKSEWLRGDCDKKCLFCDKRCQLVKSHIVPRKVLECLCDWKAEDNRGEEEGMDQNEAGKAEKREENKSIEQSKYMYMTVIDEGRRVSAKACYKKFLCELCEKRFQHIDEYARDFWKEMSQNWYKKRTISLNYKPGIDIMKAVLFSIVIRGMFLSFHWLYWPESLMCAFKMMMNEVNTYTYQETIELLDEIGFLYCYLPQIHRRYRVEFPFSCTLKLKSTQSIKAICAQVPPFFCILPEKSEDRDSLQRYLHHIIRDVHKKLQESLDHFIDKKRAEVAKRQEQNCDQQIRIINFFENPPDNGCLLFFDYLEEPLVVTVNVHVQ